MSPCTHRSDPHTTRKYDDGDGGTGGGNAVNTTLDVVNDNYVGLSMTLLRALHQGRVADALTAARAIESMVGKESLPAQSPAALLLAMQSELNVDDANKDNDNDTEGDDDEDDDDNEETQPSSSEESGDEEDSESGDADEDEDKECNGDNRRADSVVGTHVKSVRDTHESLTRARLQPAASASSSAVTVRRRLSTTPSHTARPNAPVSLKPITARRRSAVSTPKSNRQLANSFEQRTHARGGGARVISEPAPSAPNHCTAKVSDDEAGAEGHAWSAQEEAIWSEINTSVEREMQRLAIARKHR